GGTFIKVGDSTEYFGGDFKTVYDLDIDRFGYFDLVEEVEKLGVKEFDKIMYQVPKKLGYAGMKEIVDNSGVMEMINIGTKFRTIIEVYVVESNPKDDGDGANVVDNASEGSNSANRLADDDDDDEDDDDDDDANDGDKTGGGGVLPACESLGVAMCSDEDIARQNLRNCKNKMVEEDGGAKNTFPDCLHEMDLDGCEMLQHALMSEESGSEMEMDDEGNCINRKMKIIYDPRCDHNALQFELGMRFESVDQCKRALKKVAVV
ncbi:hypothetical protein STAS_19382, partial [Striga asiatica]